LSKGLNTGAKPKLQFEFPVLIKLVLHYLKPVVPSYCPIIHDFASS